jgi:hypothetical protein
MPMREPRDALVAPKCAHCWFELFELLIKPPSSPNWRCFVVLPANLVHREAKYANGRAVGRSCGVQVCAMLM